MKKLSFLAVALTAMVFASCGGNKNANANEEAQEEKSFEQEQVEASIKMHLDSLAAEVGRLKQLPFVQNDGEGALELTKEEKQVKPEYLANPANAENATTLAEKYRMLSILGVDKRIAALYEMPTDEYKAAINKLLADINDPSFKAIENAENIFETTEGLYNAMEENGRINFFWQLAAGSLVEELYIASQNTEKFLSVFDDDAASNVTFRIVLVTDAISRLAEYDEDIKPVAEAIEPLKVLNAISVDQLKSQLAEANEQIAAARAALVK
jgi:hypothetical protein